MASSVWCCLRCCRDGGTGHIPLKEMPAVQLDTQHMGKDRSSAHPTARGGPRRQCGVRQSTRHAAPGPGSLLRPPGVSRAPATQPLCLGPTARPSGAAPVIGSGCVDLGALPGSLSPRSCPRREVFPA